MKEDHTDLLKFKGHYKLQGGDNVRSRSWFVSRLFLQGESIVQDRFYKPNYNVIPPPCME